LPFGDGGWLSSQLAAIEEGLQDVLLNIQDCQQSRRASGGVLEDGRWPFSRVVGNIVVAARCEAGDDRERMFDEPVP